MQKDSYRVARRYARALFETCALADIERIEAELGQIASLYEGSKELGAALNNPAIPVAQQVAVWSEILNGSRADGLSGGNRSPLFNFVGLLQESGRIGLLPLIAERFRELVLVAKQRLTCVFVHAGPVSVAEKQEIEAQVATTCGELASVSWVLDESLLGGMIIRAGDVALDGSVAGALRRAEELRFFLGNGAMVLAP